ncbi:hydrogenase assembly protein HupF [Frankia sp. B2]|nr:hydrogenase assembly protein HupF [Frankia sp. B2]
MAAGTSAGRPAAMEAELASVHPGPAAPVCEAAGRIARSEETIEAEVIRLLPGALAVVRTPAGTEEVGIALVDAHPGDAVLVHAGEAIAVL